MRNALMITGIYLLMAVLLAASAGLCFLFPALYLANKALLLPAMLLYAGNMVAVCQLHGWLNNSVEL